MIIKKWKAGRGDKPGVLQIKLKNVSGGTVALEVVDAAGVRKTCGSILTIGSSGVDMLGLVDAEYGFTMQAGKVKVTK